MLCMHYSKRKKSSDICDMWTERVDLQISTLMLTTATKKL